MWSQVIWFIRVWFTTNIYISITSNSAEHVFSKCHLMLCVHHNIETTRVCVLWLQCMFTIIMGKLIQTKYMVPIYDTYKHKSTSDTHHNMHDHFCHKYSKASRVSKRPRSEKLSQLLSPQLWEIFLILDIGSIIAFPSTTKRSPLPSSTPWPLPLITTTSTVTPRTPWGATTPTSCLVLEEKTCCVNCVLDSSWSLGLLNHFLRIIRLWLIEFRKAVDSAYHTCPFVYV